MRKLGELFVSITGSAGSLYKTLDQAYDKTTLFVGKYGKAMEGGRDAGLAFSQAGKAIVDAMSSASQSGMDFEQAMAGAGSALLGSGADMDALSAKALQLGADTKYSATEAALGLGQLAKGGVSAYDILNGGLAGALDLAASGELAVGDAATIAANAMSIFELKGKDVSHVADLFAQASNSSTAEVKDLAESFNQSASVAHMLKVPIEDLTGTLAYMAAQGLKGSDAGTSLKTAMMRMNPTTAEAAELMDLLGISFYDSNGEFIGLAEAAGVLQSQLGSLTDQQRQEALAVIFGQDAIRAANTLYKAGEQGIRAMTVEVDKHGASQQIAAAKMDTTTGSIEQFWGSVDTAKVGLSTGLNPALRYLYDIGTQAVNVFNALPLSMQGAVGLFATISGEALQLGGSFLQTVSYIPDFVIGLGQLKQAGLAIQAMGLAGVITAAKTAAMVAAPYIVALGEAYAGWKLTSWLKDMADANQRTDELKLKSISLLMAMNEEALAEANNQSKFAEGLAVRASLSAEYERLRHNINMANDLTIQWDGTLEALVPTAEAVILNQKRLAFEFKDTAFSMGQLTDKQQAHEAFFRGQDVLVGALAETYKALKQSLADVGFTMADSFGLSTSLMQALGSRSDGLTGSMKALVDAKIKAGDEARKHAEAIQAEIDKVEELSVGISSFSPLIKDQAPAFDALVVGIYEATNEMSLYNTQFQDFESQIPKIKAYADKFGVDTLDAIKAVSQGLSELSQASDAFTMDAIKNTADYQESYRQLGQQLLALTDVQDGYWDVVDKAASRDKLIEDFAETWRIKPAEAYREASGAMDAWGEHHDRMLDEAEQAQEAYFQALEDGTDGGTWQYKGLSDSIGTAWDRTSSLYIATTDMQGSFGGIDTGISKYRDLGFEIDAAAEKQQRFASLAGQMFTSIPVLIEHGTQGTFTYNDDLAIANLIANQIVSQGIPFNEDIKNFALAAGQKYGASFQLTDDMIKQLKAGEIPKLAKGGIVTRPTLANVGERGPEAIIPLNSAQGRSMLGSGGGNTYVTINVNNGMIHESKIWELARRGGVRHRKLNLAGDLS